MGGRGRGLTARHLHWLVASRALLAMGFILGGFTLAGVQTYFASAPVINKTLSARATAYIETIDDYKGGSRLLLRVLSIEGLAPQSTPVRVRVTLRARAPFVSGTTIQAQLRLMPPPAPSEPGGYNFSRDAYFDQIGAVGSVLGRLELAPEAVQIPLRARLNAMIDRSRNLLTDRIIAHVGPSMGPVTAALVTGKRGLISEAINEDLRNAGIYHVVSISGLHMMLAAGLFLWSLRALLALFPAIALMYPIRKWAAGFALVGALAYDIFAGSEVATERSLVMIGVILIAILFDRPALSMRNLAIAALIILIREPASLLGPSFQMSFAAVAAMIAVYERPLGGSGPATHQFQGWIEKGLKLLLTMLVTTCVASLATDPYSLFHFHRFNPYGLFGNALTLPIVEFIIMPMSLLGVLAWPFGLDLPFWWVAGQGIWLMMQSAHYVSALSGSAIYLPAFSGASLMWLSAALVWLTLWHSWIRWGGLVFAMLGVTLALHTPRPDLRIDAQGRTLALRSASGSYEILNAQANLFAVSQWLSADGDARSPNDPKLNGTSRCDRLACVGLMASGHQLALIKDAAAVPEDCRRADLVVTFLRLGTTCQGPDLVLDGRFFDLYGASQISFGPEGEPILTSERGPMTDRPWASARRKTFVARDLLKGAQPHSTSSPAQNAAPIDPGDVSDDNLMLDDTVASESENLFEANGAETSGRR
ncbi:MAG: ComEC family competence protein [Alphaproteobacteria bacterium]|nr:ComEC family competence protein [Alphaproteobacteria bacterium]